MSRKHNQRTRAEILAKRNLHVLELPVQKKVLAPNGQTLYIPQPTHSERLRAAFDASMSRPRTGAKEQERAKRCYMSPTFNCSGNLRATPVMHQIARASEYHEVQDWQYDSVF